MATGKKFYWIKLKNTFLTSEKVDYLLSQKDGANYVVIYQMLCLKTINTDGVLGTTIGEVMIPYDIAKIQRDLKHFSIDTIRIALNLYRALGMVYEQEDGLIKIAEFGELIGSETDYAQKQRNYRQVKDNGGDIVSIEIRDKRLEKEKDKKHIYGTYKHVRLTDEEVKKLNDEYSDIYTGKFIQFLDDYIEISGKSYKSHYLVIKKWVVDAVMQKEDKEAHQEKKKYVATDIKPNYEQTNTEVDTSNLDRFLKERTANG